MESTSASPRGPGTNRSRTGLAVLQIFIGLGGVAGGWGLAAAPDGSNMGMSADALAASPFTDFLIPGLVLLAVNGICQLVGSGLTLAVSRIHPEAAIALGTFLMAWIVAQVAWIGLIHWMQPLYFGFGAVEAILGMRLRRSVRAA